MKKVLMILICAAALAAVTGCRQEPYNRYGSKMQVENLFRSKVFAPFHSEGRFDATYALATIASGPDKEGYYKVTFTNGPRAGETIRTKDVIIKTAPADPEEIKKGDIVLFDFSNPKDMTKSSLARWNKAVVYDAREAVTKNRVVLEFPHDSNDFMATRESVYPTSLRFIVKPTIKDPRTFIP